MRTGIGFDIHRLEKGRKLVIGGVEIPYHKGLAGHSDGDVLFHSISDALLGAMGKPDIGHYFPDTEEDLKGMDSALIVGRVMSFVEKGGFIIQNIDAVIICEEPKLLPHFDAIRSNISRLTSVPEERIGLKAKTFERIGDIGGGKACACMVSVLLEEQGNIKGKF